MPTTEQRRHRREERRHADRPRSPRPECRRTPLGKPSSSSRGDRLTPEEERLVPDEDELSLVSGTVETNMPRPPDIIGTPTASSRLYSSGSDLLLEAEIMVDSEQRPRAASHPSKAAQHALRFPPEGVDGVERSASFTPSARAGSSPRGSPPRTPAEFSPASPLSPDMGHRRVPSSPSLGLNHPTSVPSAFTLGAALDSKASALSPRALTMSSSGGARVCPYDGASAGGVAAAADVTLDMVSPTAHMASSSPGLDDGLSGVDPDGSESTSPASDDEQQTRHRVAPADYPFDHQCAATPHTVHAYTSLRCIDGAQCTHSLRPLHLLFNAQCTYLSTAFFCTLTALLHCVCVLQVRSRRAVRQPRTAGKHLFLDRWEHLALSLRRQPSDRHHEPTYQARGTRHSLPCGDIDGLLTQCTHSPLQPCTLLTTTPHTAPSHRPRTLHCSTALFSVTRVARALCVLQVRT
jgi:hypothetical protein